VATFNGAQRAAFPGANRLSRGNSTVHQITVTSRERKQFRAKVARTITRGRTREGKVLLALGKKKIESVHAFPSPHRRKRDQ